MPESQKSSFSIFFDTPETEDHTMNAEELGQSIVAMSNALKQADKIINGEDSYITVKVSAPEEGSIGIPFDIVVLGTSIDVVQLIGLSTAAGATIGGVSGSVLGVLDWIKSRKIVAVERTTEGGSKITVENGGETETLDVDTELEKLATNVEFRGEMHKALFAPVRNKTDAKVLIKDESGDLVYHEFDEVKVKNLAKIPRKTLESVDEEIKTVHARFTKIDFEKRTGWVINYLNENQTVSINDEAFLHRNKASENSFKSGDMFEIDLKIITKEHPDRGVVSKYSIERVHRKITGSRNRN